MKSDIMGDAEKLTWTITNRIDSYINERLVDLINISDYMSLKNTLMNSNDEFSKIDNVKAHIDTKSQEWVSVPKNTTSPFMKSLTYNPDSDKIREFMSTENNIFGHDVFNDIFVTNAYGVVVAESQKIQKYYHGDDRDWQETKKNGIYISSIIYDKDVGYPTIGISKRIDDKNGNFLGVVKGTINMAIILNTIQYELKSLKFNPTYYEIINNNGRVLYSDDKNHTPFRFTYAPEFMSKLKQSSNGTFIEDKQDPFGKYIVTHVDSSTTKLFSKDHWTFVTKINYDTAMKSTNEQFGYLITTMNVGIGIVVLMILFGTKKITTSLRKVSERLAVIPINRTVGKVTGIYEIDELIGKFDSANQTLAESNAALKEIGKAKEEFAAMISHELKTPLFPIKFNAEMLKDPKILGSLTDEQLKSVNEIYTNSIKLDKLVNDILDVHKLEIRSMKFKKMEFELRGFMTRVYESNMLFMKDKQIQFINNTEEKITLICDPDRLEQVFSNLIKNSVDFVAEKSGRIEIGAKSQGTDILFYVKDNGSGIPKDKIANIFQKFYQIDTSITRKHLGSGLGLSICKGIIEGLGGKIWIDSTVGVGTIVQFTIPKGNNK